MKHVIHTSKGNVFGDLEEDLFWIEPAGQEVVNNLFDHDVFVRADGDKKALPVEANFVKIPLSDPFLRCPEYELFEVPESKQDLYDIAWRSFRSMHGATPDSGES